MMPVIRRITDVYELGVRSTTCEFDRSDVVPLALAVIFDWLLSDETAAKGLSIVENDEARAEGSNGEPGAQTEAKQRVKHATSDPNPNNPVQEIGSCKNCKNEI